MTEAVKLPEPALQRLHEWILSFPTRWDPTKDLIDARVKKGQPSYLDWRPVAARKLHDLMQEWAQDLPPDVELHFGDGGDVYVESGSIGVKRPRGNKFFGSSPAP